MRCNHSRRRRSWAAPLTAAARRFVRDQRANAGVLERAGGAIRLDQTIFTPERVAAEIATLAAAPERLTAMARAAQSSGVVDAAERLADLVLRVAGVIPPRR